VRTRSGERQRFQASTARGLRCWRGYDSFFFVCGAVWLPCSFARFLLLAVVAVGAPVVGVGTLRWTWNAATNISFAFE
jgi:hypothetical protein